MYEFIEGKIESITPSYLVVLVNGIGYRVVMPNPYDYEEGQQARIYIEQIVRETELSLYGFAQLTDKLLFQKLLSVSGIGPKSALAILANANTSALSQAVTDQNSNYLTQFPGIGKKTAQQIVLDLAGKMSEFNPEGETKETTTTSTNQALSDALAALSALGYTTKDLKVVEEALSGQVLTTDQYMRQGLKLLVK